MTIEADLRARIAELEAQIAAISRTLTPREVKIIGLVADGHTNEEIAGMLFLSIRTVKGNLTKLRSKLSARNTPHARGC